VSTTQFRRAGLLVTADTCLPSMEVGEYGLLSVLQQPQQCISFSSFYFGFFTFSAVNIFEDSAAVIVVYCSVTEGVFRSPSSHSVKGS